MSNEKRSDHLRNQPAQPRSAATVETLLAAASSLIAEQGLPGFNTNAVAKAAGVNVATLYHYFPDKTAILRELFERNEAERAALAQSLIDNLATTEDLGQWIADTATALRLQRRNQPTGIALRRAMKTVPELMAAEDAVNSAVAGHLAGAVRRRFPGLASGREFVVARTMIEVAAGTFDAADNAPDQAPAIMAELESLMRGYLAELTDPTAAAGPA